MQWQHTPVLFCLENLMDGRAWWAAVHGIAKSRTRLRNWTELNFRKQGNLLKASWAAIRWVDLLTHLTHISNSLRPHGLYSPWNSPGQKNTAVGSFPSPRDLPNPGIEPRSPSLQADSLPVEPQGKPKNTGVHSLSFLQWIFLTHELNQSLLHCRWILYQLSYQGSPPHPPTRILKFM